VLALTALLFIDHFVIFEALAELLPDSRLILSGLFLMICYWVLFYVLFKRILKQDEDNKISVGYLTAFACLIVLFSQVIFQSYQQTTIAEITNEHRIRIFLIGVFGSTGSAGLFALTIALDLRLKNRWVTTLAIVVLGCLFYFGGPYILSFVKGL